eukprot:677836-Pleurochrysis_carterae.AAC.2
MSAPQMRFYTEASHRDVAENGLQMSTANVRCAPFGGVAYSTLLTCMLARFHLWTRAWMYCGHV